MSKVKNIFLALCFGVVGAIIYDTIFPEYKYYYGERELPKERYLKIMSTSSYEANKSYKKRQLNPITILLGGVIAVGMFIVEPLKKKI